MLKDEIRRLRKGLKLSQAELAEALHVSQPTITSWENGIRKPDIDMLPVIARFFNVSLDVLCGFEKVDDDRELWEAREAARRDPDRRVLFSLAKGGSKSDVEAAVKMIDALRATNPNFYSGDDPA